MNDISTIEAPRHAPTALVATGGRVQGIIPRDIDQVWRIAQMIHKADMAPKDFKTAEKVAVAILHGAEIGLPPMMALQRIAVINGRPSVWGEAVPGIALATGLVEDWVERVDGEGDHMVAMCRVKRKGIKTPAEKTFSVADARKAGLWGKAGPWTQYSKRMLTMRARVAFRDLFADALGGLYIAEELIGVDEPRDITPPKIEPALVPSDGEKIALPPTIAERPQQAHVEQSLDGEIMPPKGLRPLPPLANKKPATPPKYVTPQNPEEMLAWIDKRLANISLPDNLADVWETECLPKTEGAFPPDCEAANAIYRKHEKRLAP